MATRYVALGPLLSGENSRAFLGLYVANDVPSPCVLVWASEDLAAEPELAERLRRDTAHATLLLHTNVVRVYGLVDLDDGLARAVEFVDGESLRRLLDVAGRLPPGLAARVTADAAAGVQYAHLSGNEDGTPLVHGDLRPETVLVSYAGVAKVSGYGALSVAPREQGGKRVIGRRQHCAPEQLVGGRLAVTPRTDVYLLGVLLYEALTGQIPFVDADDFDVAVLTREPSLLQTDAIPLALRPVIARAMAKKAGQRYATAQELRDAVEAAVGGLPDRAELAAFVQRAFADDGARAARQRELEAGMQEWRAIRAAAVSPAAEPAGGPPVPAPRAMPSPPAAPAPATLGAARVERLAGHAIPTPIPAAPTPPPWRSVVGAVVASAVLAAAAVAIWIARQGAPEPELAPAAAPPRAAPSTTAAPPPRAPAPERSPAPAVMPPAPARRAAPEADEAPGAPPAPAPAPRAHATAPRPSAPATPRRSTLEVVTDPPLAVAVDGKSVGRAPVTTDLAPGTHRVTLTDPARHIRLVRTVRAQGGPTRLDVAVGKGSVVVHAPDGCEVRLDGVVVGRTPLAGAVPAYEGEHEIQVSLGDAKWKQGFSLTDGEEVTADVVFQQRGP